MPETPSTIQIERSGSAGPRSPAEGGVSIVFSTFPDPETAARISRTLVDEQLAACVSLVPQVRSIYRWKGAVSDDMETLAIIKTTATGYAALAARLVELHPYEVPEVIALSPADGHPPYLAWIVNSLEPES